MNELNYPPVAPGEDSPVWSGLGFVRGGPTARVLAYEVCESSGADDLTELNEDVTDASAYFIDKASRQHAMEELKRVLGSQPASMMELACSAGHLPANMRKALPNARMTGGKCTLATLMKLCVKTPDRPRIRFNLADSPRPSSSSDAMALLNEFEHIDDYAVAIQHVALMMRPDEISAIDEPNFAISLQRRCR